MKRQVSCELSGCYVVTKVEVIRFVDEANRVKRQVVLEDGKVVEDTGPLVTTNTTEDTETQEHHQTETRICLNCNVSILNEITAIENDPTYLRLNVLTQTSSHSCAICDAVENLQRLTIQCRVIVFVTKNIYISESVRVCQQQLDENGATIVSVSTGIKNRDNTEKWKYHDINSFTDEELNSNVCVPYPKINFVSFMIIVNLCQEKLRKLGGEDEPDGPKALEGGENNVAADKSNWVAVPNPDGIVREVKERKVISREETEEVKETEDVQHLGDITDEVGSQTFYTTKELFDLVENEEFWEADVYITPPNDGMESEEDSDNDESPSANVNHLSGRQMQSEACAKIKKLDGVVYVEDNDQEENDETFFEANLQPGTSANAFEESEELSDGNASDDSENIPLARLVTQTNKQRVEANFDRNWNKTDLTPSFSTFILPNATDNEIIFPDAVVCFESFFNIDICNFLVEMFGLYARQKGDHNFRTDKGEIKCFIAILYLSGHIQVPRWRMLWKVDTDII
ncbi:hypothetical protein NQ314_006996 [Rhamnusium bicolor]|uniref:PiggyBac transposable element-derived protein domain-containing protein n=1 Tax=Rhamnusium bicolor TaxID=1586634 RepID=A0AAV8YUZ5_9CUCU|nr:hypothetical protein NQ314_006996 [Rhamnusium bicolor]